MTPIDTTAKRQAEPRRRDDELAALIAACGRDERPALEALYKLSAARLYGVALKSGADRHAADLALVQTYLTIFSEAGSFERSRDEPMTWLLAALARQLPDMVKLTKAHAIKPVEPSGELWQKLDIALGLKRLDRHIKPGVATQARGRDPMPNAYDRQIERQLRFWRVTSIVSLLVGVAAIGAILALGLEGGPPGLLARPDVDLTQPSTEPVVVAVPSTPAIEPTVPETAPAESASAAPAAAAAGAPWLAILQPAAGSRVWRVEHQAGGLDVTAMPPFTLVSDGEAGLGESPRSLVLWAVSEASGSFRHLGTLEPETTTRLALPSELDARMLNLVISLETADGSPGAAPAGPLLFAGERAP